MEEAPEQQVMREGPLGVKISVDLSVPWVPEDEILESFEFDNELTWRFWADVKKAEICISIVFIIGILFLPCSLVELYFLESNMADAAYNRWLAVSRDSIFVIRKKRKTGLRYDCQDVGEIRKMIPIANVQDVMVTEPAGTAVCCFVPNVLNSVQVQTAAAHGDGEGGPHHDPSQACLVGLRDPKRFRDVIMGLKKGRYAEKDGQQQSFKVPKVVPLGAEQPADGEAQETLSQILKTLQSIDRKLDGKVIVDALPGVPTQPAS